MPLQNAENTACQPRSCFHCILLDSGPEAEATRIQGPLRIGIERAMKGGAKVPISYESRLAKLELKEDERSQQFVDHWNELHHVDSSGD